VRKMVTAGSEEKVEEEKVEEWHPLLPVEKKLIAYSLVLAVISVIFLIWISYTYFGIKSR